MTPLPTLEGRVMADLGQQLVASRRTAARLEQAIREALHALCVTQDTRGAFETLAAALHACDGCGGTGIAYDRRASDDAPLICCGGPR